MSYLKKHEKYLDHFVRNRFLTVFVNFDIAVLIYLIMDFIIGDRYPVSRILLSFLGWESIGNSNWYIFVILVMYLIFFASFALFKNRPSTFNSLLTLLVLSLAFVLTMQYAKGNQVWWYVTTLCFTAGVFFAYISDDFKKLMNSKPRFWICLLILIGAFAYMTFNRYDYSALYFNLYAVIFMLIVIMISMKIKFANPVFEWLGSHLFEIYIFMRIPMTIFSKYEIATNNHYLFSFLCLAVTLAIAEVMHLFYELINKKIRY